MGLKHDHSVSCPIFAIPFKYRTAVFVCAEYPPCLQNQSHLILNRLGLRQEYNTMAKQLGILQRIAVALTVAWIVGAALFLVVSEIDSYNLSHAEEAYECRAKQEFSSGSSERCQRTADEVMGPRISMLEVVQYFALSSFLAGLFWLIFCILIWLPIKWILAGRKQTGSD